MSAPAVAVSANGKKFAVAWKDIRTGEPNVYWSISDKPELAEGQLVHDEARGNQDHPSLCIDASGTVWVAWEDSRAGQKRIWVRSSRTGDVGRSLSNPVERASFPTIATSKDLVAVVYESQNEDRKTVQFRLISSGQS
jgi:sugar lactone lactonase YvrE